MASVRRMVTENIETCRLLLRPWRRENVDLYAHICSDPETMRNTFSGVLTHEQAAEKTR